jgi:hypothetical protein
MIVYVDLKNFNGFYGENRNEYFFQKADWKIWTLVPANYFIYRFYRKIRFFANIFYNIVFLSPASDWEEQLTMTNVLLRFVSAGFEPTHTFRKMLIRKKVGWLRLQWSPYKQLYFLEKNIIGDIKSLRKLCTNQIVVYIYLDFRVPTYLHT